MSKLSELVAEIQRRTAVETRLGQMTPENRALVANARAELEAIASCVRPAIRRRNALKRELAELEASLMPYDRARSRLSQVRKATAKEGERRYDRLCRYSADTNLLIGQLDLLDPEWRERVIHGGPMLRPDHETFEAK